jgi:hypothetical protein
MDEPAPAIESAAPEPIVCPNCGAALPAEVDPSQSIIHCPNCNSDFFPAVEGEPESAAEWPEPDDPDAEATREPEGELDGLRIRKMVQVRRSAIRARTYAVVIMICCLVMGVQLIFTDIQEVHSYGWDQWAILYAVLAGLMAIGATVSSGKAAVLHRESKFSSTAETEHAPEFDPLSDGSHHVKNLQEMQGGAPADEPDQI